MTMHNFLQGQHDDVKLLQGQPDHVQILPRPSRRRSNSSKSPPLHQFDTLKSFIALEVYKR